VNKFLILAVALASRVSAAAGNESSTSEYTSTAEKQCVAIEEQEIGASF
jgi:hypothetical protein